MIYILKLGRRKTVINFSVFMVLIFGITFWVDNKWVDNNKKIPIDVSYACFKMVSKKYLQSNINPYRIT